MLVKNMLVYVIDEYRDAFGYGSFDVFETCADALVEARRRWGHMNDIDVKTYTNDRNGVAWFRVNEYGAAINDDGEVILEDDPRATIWDALEGKEGK